MRVGIHDAGSEHFCQSGRRARLQQAGSCARAVPAQDVFITDRNTG
jgi:hypothetical protein